MLDLSKPITKYSDALGSDPGESSLEAFILACREAEIIEEIVRRVKAGTDPKNSLPCIVPSGKCRPGTRNSREFDFGSHTGILGYDLDHLSEPEKVRQVLKGELGWAGAYITSSGSGVRAYLAVAPVPTDKPSHIRAYFQGAEYLKNIVHKVYPGIDVSTDTVCQDPGRLNFVGWDTGAWLNEDTKHLSLIHI